MRCACLSLSLSLSFSVSFCCSGELVNDAHQQHKSADISHDDEFSYMVHVGVLGEEEWDGDEGCCSIRSSSSCGGRDRIFFW